MATFAYFRVVSNVELEGVAGIRDSIFLCSVVPFPIGLVVFFLGYTPHTPRYGSTVGPSNPTEQSSFLALSQGLGLYTELRMCSSAYLPVLLWLQIVASDRRHNMQSSSITLIQWHFLCFEMCNVTALDMFYVDVLQTLRFVQELLENVYKFSM